MFLLVKEYIYVPVFLGTESDLHDVDRGSEGPCPYRRPDPCLRERIKPGSVFHIQEYTAQNLGGIPDSDRKQ